MNCELSLLPSPPHFVRNRDCKSRSLVKGHLMTPADEIGWHFLKDGVPQLRWLQDSEFSLKKSGDWEPKNPFNRHLCHFHRWWDFGVNVIMLAVGTSSFSKPHSAWTVSSRLQLARNATTFLIRYCCASMDLWHNRWDTRVSLHTTMK